MLSEFRDTAGLVMQSQGVDIESDWGKAEFEKALDFIEQKIEEGYIRKVKGNSYMEDLTSGNAVAGITWSGDIFVLAADTEDPNWTFTIPESGGTLWSDNMMVPITSTHRSQRPDADGLLLRPGGRGAGGRVGQLRVSRRRRPGRDGEDRPRARREPVHLPDAPSYIEENNIQPFRVLDADEDIEFADLWSTKVMGN